MDLSSQPEAPLWQRIIKKLQPYLTKTGVLELDVSRFSSLVKRLFEINELSEQEYNYAKKNRDMILLRMGLIFAIPGIDTETLELALKQIATKLVSIYYNNNICSTYDEAEKKVLEVIQVGIKKEITMALNPEKEFEVLRKKLRTFSKITLENADEVAKVLDEVKERLIEIGISGQIIHEINNYYRLLRSRNKDKFPTKEELIEEAFSWQEKLKG